MVNTWEPPPEYLSSIDAGNQSLSAGDWQKARTHFQAALEVLQTAEACEGLANAAWWLDETDELFSNREHAYVLYRDAEDQLGAARMATWLALDYYIFRRSPAIANGWLQRAQRLLDQIERPMVEHCLLAFARGHIALENLDVEGVQHHAREALNLAREVGAFDLEMLSLSLLGLGTVSAGDVERGMVMLDEAGSAATAGEISDPDAIVTSCCYLFYACERVQDFRRASEWCEVLVDLCKRWDYRSMVSVCRGHYASILIWQGDWAHAERELISATDELLATRAGWAPEGQLRLADLRRLQGQFEAAEELYERIQDHPYSLLGRGELAFERGDLLGAKDLVDRFLRRLPERAVTDRLSALDVRLQIAIQLDSDDVDAALEALSTTAELISTGPVRATAIRARGRVAANRGEFDTARTCFEDAIDLFVSSNAMFEAARTRLELARTLANGNRHEVAAAECRSALNMFERIGAGPDQERALVLLQETARTIESSSRTAIAYPGLSRRESEILRLISIGYTNPEIAEELYLSVRTVERHVSSIYQKLGAEGKAARAVVTAFALEHTFPKTPDSS